MDWRSQECHHFIQQRYSLSLKQLIIYQFIKDLDKSTFLRSNQQFQLRRVVFCDHCSSVRRPCYKKYLL